MSRLAFLLSLAAHALVLWLCFRTRTVSSPPPPPTEIEIAEVPRVEKAPSEARAARGSPSARGVRGSAPKPLSLHDLRLLPQSTPEGSPSAGSSRGRGAPLAYGAGTGNVLAQLSGTVTYDAIYRRIDEVLTYPGELSERGIEGVVKARLRFENDGSWNESAARVTGPSPYLRVVVWNVIDRAFEEKLPATYFAHGRALEVTCVFEFEVTRKENPLDASENAVASRRTFTGDHLYFYRYSKLIGEWSIGPVHGYGLVPSVGIDPEEVIDGVKQLLKPKAKADPLDRYRHDPRFRRE